MSNSNQATVDCLVVGAGPAGLTAAIYLARFRRRVTLIDGGTSRAELIPQSRNCFGFPEGVSGRELLERLQRQAECYAIDTRRGWVSELAREGDGFAAVVGENPQDKATLRARSVLLCTGIADAVPDIDDWEAAIRTGAMRLCPVCDAFEVIDRKVAMMVSPRNRLKHILFMRQYTDDLTVLTHGCGDPLTQHERSVLTRSGIRTLDEAIVAMRADNGGALVVTEGGQEHRFDTLYPMLGATARSDLASRLGARCNEAGEIEVDARQESTVPGVYAAGDIVNALNQISVAAGQAAIAATAIHNRLLDTDV